ncbi:hypothetical protein PM03_16215 [Thalassobacter stenotrophicus]|uniref:hypothetical protein n=1 Tax=Thalassobacter stenotrophicus TaxID=266809 RepID=UPI00051FD41F|nr:hypothetical protein [Thalassobacter stenotrophicus]KGK78106.1 hypothetical protein PM03_16215 [Thalassobacter stenotrophicus]
MDWVVGAGIFDTRLAHYGDDPQGLVVFCASLFYLPFFVTFAFWHAATRFSGAPILSAERRCIKEIFLKQKCVIAGLCVISYLYAFISLGVRARGSPNNTSWLL